MRKIIIILMIVLMVVSFVIGYMLVTSKERPDRKDNEVKEQDTSADNKPDTQTARPSEEVKDPVQEQLKQLSLDEKIGQMVMAGVNGYINDDHSRRLIESYQVGGFVLLKQNVKSSAQVLSLLNDLKAANSKNRIPLFLSVDEEGGRITRMPEEFVKLPSSQRTGEVNNGDFSFEVGSILGEELKEFGFNMDFAPVLDINSNPKNPVIGDRSFGTDSETVSKLGLQTMKGIRSQNIIPVVKHFPGHGDTSTDSHKGLPIVNHDLKRLESFEFIPFSEAVKNHAEVVMVAHILLSEIDVQNPASMSETIITGILRKSLSFSGVVITDDMTMGAITKNYDIGDAAVKSVNAGSDIILVCHDDEKVLAVIDSLKSAAASGKIPMARIDESVYRILKLKHEYSLADYPIASIDVKKINSKINSVLSRYLNEVGLNN